MPLSASQLLDGISSLSILTSPQIEKVREGLSPEQLAADAETVIRQLVQDGKLTKFQAVNLYKGRGKGLIFGEYVVLDKIGEGGMGQVYKAQHRRMKRIAALKILPPQAMNSPKAVQRFFQEVEVAAKLTHPNIVVAHDAGEANGVHFLVMEYVEGLDLSSYVTKHGPLGVEQAANVILQAARGLAYAHSLGVIHRDIKPSNLLLNRQGQVKILDMGLARFTSAIADPGTEQNELTVSGEVMGTVDYMAPEQAADTRTADHRADIYALGCTLYRILTGKPPYPGDTVIKKILAHRERPIPSLSDERRDVPPVLDRVFRKMVAKDVADRTGAMTQVISALEQLLAGVADERSSVVVTDEIMPSYDAGGLSFLEQGTGASGLQQVATARLATVKGGSTLGSLNEPRATQAQRPSTAKAVKVSQAKRLVEPTTTAAAEAATSSSNRRSPSHAVLVGGGAAATAIVIGIALFFGLRKSEEPSPEVPVAVVTTPRPATIVAPAPIVATPSATPPLVPTPSPTPPISAPVAAPSATPVATSFFGLPPTVAAPPAPTGTIVPAPKASGTATAIATPARPTSIPVSSATPSGTAVASIPPSSPPPVKPMPLPIPSQSEQAQARNAIVAAVPDAFGTNLNVEAKVANAELLRRRAATTLDVPAERYVCLSEAIRLANEAGDLDVLFAAVDDLTKVFAVDRVELLRKSLEETFDATRPAALKLKLVADGLEIFDQAGRDEKFDMALMLNMILQRVPKIDPDILLELKTRAVEQTQWQKEQAAYTSALPILKEKPDDPAANLSVGRYLGFVRDDWNVARRHLSKGADDALVAIAGLEETALTDAEKQTVIADKWWELHLKAPLPLKWLYAERAAYWYQIAYAVASVKTKKLIDRRTGPLAQLRKTSGNAFAARHPLNTTKIGNNWYLVVRDSKRLTPGQAQALCIENGGYLAILSNPMERQAVAQYVHQSGVSSVLVGARESPIAGRWVWLDGTPITENVGANTSHRFCELSVQGSIGNLTTTLNSYNEGFTVYLCEWDR